MNPQDQAALEWAHANPKDPRAINIQAKIWATQNPEDPRSDKIMEQLSKKTSTPPTQTPGSPPPTPPQPTQPNPYEVASVQQTKSDEKVAIDKKQHVMDLIHKPIEEGGTAISPETVNQMGANTLLPGIGSKMAQGMGALGRIGIGSLMGATQGAVNSPTSPLAGAAAGGIAGIGGSTLLEGAQGILGGVKGMAGNLSTAMQIHKADPELYNAARSKIEDAMTTLGNPGPAENQGGAEYLRNMTSKPITSLTTNNPDKRMLINALGDESGTNLADYAKSLRSAKKTASNPIKSGIPQTIKMGVAGAADSLSSGSGIANDPRTLSALLSALTNK